MSWEGELYLEGHNGTYTSMAEHKYYIDIWRNQFIFWFVQCQSSKKEKEVKNLYCSYYTKENKNKCLPMG